MKKILTLFVLSGLLAACSTVKNATKPPAPIAQGEASSVVYQVAARALSEKNITAKISADVEANGRAIALGGHLRMRRDEVVQLQLTFLGFAEVGRIEFSPAGVLVIDRLHKQYVRARYDQVDFLRQAGLDFYSLQSLFWSELFVPGEPAVQRALSRFVASSSGSYTLLMPKETPRLEYAFLATTATGLLERLTVRSREGGEKGEFVTRYGDYTAFGGSLFPKKIALTATGGGKTFSLGLTLSALSNASDWQAHTPPPAKYEQRSPEDAFSSLFSM